MVLFNMTKADTTILEQHVGTVMGVVVVGLLSWLLYSVNGLQITMAKISSEISHINTQSTVLSNNAQRFDARMDSLERRVDRIETKYSDGK